MHFIYSVQFLPTVCTVPYINPAPPPFDGEFTPAQPKPTTATPDGRPSLPVYYKQFSSHPKTTRFTTEQLHSLLGSRSLKRWFDLDDMAAPTVTYPLTKTPTYTH